MSRGLSRSGTSWHDQGGYENLQRAFGTGSRVCGRFARACGTYRSARSPFADNTRGAAYEAVECLQHQLPIFINSGAGSGDSGIAGLDRDDASIQDVVMIGLRQRQSGVADKLADAGIQLQQDADEDIGQIEGLSLQIGQRCGAL